MQWFWLLAAAIAFTNLGKHLQSRDEVYAIATYSAGILSALWGFAIAPTAAQLTLGILALGWLQVSSFRTSDL